VQNSGFYTIFNMELLLWGKWDLR